MYPTSQAYKTAIKKSLIEYDIIGEIAGTQFSKNRILKNSLTISNKCSNNNEIKIGSVFIGELSVVLFVDEYNYDLIDEEISFSCGVKIGANQYEYVPMGVFNIAEAKKTQNGLSIKAYDNMSKLDKPFSEQAQGTAYQIASYACGQCNVILANDDFNAFVNSSQELSAYPDSDIETYRDLISWIAQTVGCFVTANRDGEIEFRAYNDTVVDTIGTPNRFGGSYGDYETWYTQITVENMEDGSESSYALQTNDGLNYELGANPFLQYDNYTVARTNILGALSIIHYVPFSVQFAADPSYDLGDIVSFPNGIGDASKLFCITQFSWNYNGTMSISGGGQNPRLMTVKSKTEKQIKSLNKKSDNDLIQYYSFTNMEDISIADGDTEVIIDIRYSAVKKTVAIFLAEVLAEIETTVSGINYYDGEAEFFYYVDSELIERIPKENWTDGEHIKHLLYYLDSSGGVIHRLQIRCKMTGGSALIPEGAIKACIYGQNLLASDDWSGHLEFEESAPDWNLVDISFESVNDSVQEGFNQ